MWVAAQECHLEEETLTFRSSKKQNFKKNTQQLSVHVKKDGWTEE